MGTQFLSFRTDLRASLFRKKVLYDSVHNTPTDEIELGHCRRQTLELNACSTTEWIEQLLGIAVQTRLVRHMYGEYLTVWSRV